MSTGKKIWVFPDGDLPSVGDGLKKGHESLIILNSSNKNTKISFEIYFEDKDPVKDITATIKAQRVRCFRLDSPIGDDRTFQIPFGQYSLNRLAVKFIKYSFIIPYWLYYNPFQRELEHFIRCITTGTRPITSSEDGKISLEIALKAIESAQSGKKIQLSL